MKRENIQSPACPSDDQLGEEIAMYWPTLLFPPVSKFGAVLAVSGCCGFSRAAASGSYYSRCGAQDSHSAAFSRRGAQALVRGRLRSRSSGAQWFRLLGSGALARSSRGTRLAERHGGSSGTGGGTQVPCLGRRILTQCTTRKVPILAGIYYWKCMRLVYLRGPLSPRALRFVKNSGNTKPKDLTVPSPFATKV